MVDASQRVATKEARFPPRPERRGLQREDTMSTYNDALLALGQYVYANSAFIRCDHPHPALREQINERLTGLVDAVDSAAMEDESDE